MNNKYIKNIEPDIKTYIFSIEDYMHLADEVIEDKIGDTLYIKLYIDRETDFPCIVVSEEENTEEELQALSDAIYDPQEWFVFTEDLIKIAFNSKEAYVTSRFNDITLETEIIVEVYKEEEL